MNGYVVMILGLHIVSAAPPLRLEIDCGSPENDGGLLQSYPSELNSRFNIASLCSIIHKTIPKAVKDGKFFLIGEPADQSRASDNQLEVSVKPPKGFVPKLGLGTEKRLMSILGPKFRAPKVKVPKLKVPKLKSTGRLAAPRVGAPMNFPSSFRARNREEEESSAERMEKLKKGVQKMLHVVKVLGQIDQYVSERTRIIVDLLTKTFAEP